MVEICKTKLEKWIKLFKEGISNKQTINLCFISLSPKPKKQNIQVPIIQSVQELGISVSMDIQNYEKFLQFLFPECSIENHEKTGYGFPDFVIKKDSKEIYIEIKNGKDGIRRNQLEWFIENQDRECYFLFIGNSPQILEPKQLNGTDDSNFFDWEA